MDYYITANSRVRKLRSLAMKNSDGTLNVESYQRRISKTGEEKVPGANDLMN